MKFKNRSPLGALDIPGVGVVEYGDTFEVEGEQAASFERQPDNFLRTDTPARKRAAKNRATKKAAEPAVTPDPADGDTADGENQE